MYGLQKLLAFLVSVSISQAHTVITYPGWRGNNLHTNGTLPEDNPDSLGIDVGENGTVTFPWGQQWMYPCGGMPQTNNRTKWPVDGGGISIQPGWFPGHSRAQVYINIGIQESGHLAPRNMSHPVHPPFEITGPHNLQYNGQFCIPQIGMPANLSLKVGDNITIQVVEHAQHGAALYSCVDVTLAEPEDVEEINELNCYNSSEIGFNMIYSSPQSTGAAPATTSSVVPALLVAAAVTMIGGFVA
ncbi:hypothetical protein Q7P37_011132 [Cladosporium fusiforme]